MRKIFNPVLMIQRSPALVDHSALTLDPVGIQAVKDMLFKAKFVSAPYKDILTIVPGIKQKTQIVISGNFDGLLGANRENCDITPDAGSITLTQDYWDLAKIAGRLEECHDNINASTFWKQFKKPGLAGYNLEGTEYEAYVLEQFQKYLTDDMMYRLLFLSNTGITEGGTNTLNAGQLKYFNSFNGYFALLEAIATTTPARKITITENAGANYAAQAFAAASPTVHPVEDYMAQVYAACPLEVREAADAEFVVSQTVFDQLRLERQAKTNLESAYTRLETGIKQLDYQGIPVRALPVIDRLLKRHFDNGTKVENPHFIILIQKSRLMLGVEDEGSISELSSKYDDYHETLVLKFATYMQPAIPMKAEVQFAR